MGAATLTCLFCKSTFPSGRKGEDIISGWYAKAIGHPVTGEVLFGLADSTASVFSDPVPSQTVAAKGFRVPDVCPSCSNGWMSQIEKRAKPHLLQMMAGVDLTLTHEAQRAVAAWAQLKAVLWDQLELSARLPESIRHTFSVDHPMRTLSVVLAKIASESAMDILFVRQVGTLSFIGSGGAHEVVRVTIRFDHLVLQVSLALGRGDLYVRGTRAEGRYRSIKVKLEREIDRLHAVAVVLNGLDVPGLYVPHEPL